ncbi:MAG: hypothetical protein IT372_12275 [Polyangiaceae bacterium]|nr:hypothetical protein [Polyangiaceae bacterium]
MAAASGCASARGAGGQPAAPVHAEAEKPGCPFPGAHDHPPAEATAQPAQAFVLPKEAGPGEPQEKKVLVDNQFVKLVTITLRGGAVMPEHAAPLPVTIEALSGGGVVRLGTSEMRVDREHIVALGPGVPHAVVPDAGTDLVLLLHAMKPGAKK